MSALLNHLHQDHQHIRVLLTILKNKLVTLDIGAKPNFSLLGEVVDYLQDYGDQYHHVIEDQIYQCLFRNHPESKLLVDDQYQQHKALRELTGTLRQSIDSVMVDEPLPLEQFSLLLRRFVDKQADHLECEERKMFPLIEQQLTASDWRELEETLPARVDPLFGESLDRRYAQLYEELIEDLS